ncbi:MAG: hypothetical protein ACM34E_10620 [Acidobacteriota bacterium]|jgi:hypothetical protein
MEIPERSRQAMPLSEREEEARKIRRLQIMMSMVMSVISQDPDLTVEEASEMVANTKRAALAMFPDKEFTYDILYKPRLQRLMNERFRLQ